MSLLSRPLRPFRYLKGRLEPARQLATPMASCRTRAMGTRVRSRLHHQQQQKCASGKLPSFWCSAPPRSATALADTVSSRCRVLVTFDAKCNHKRVAVDELAREILASSHACGRAAAAEMREQAPSGIWQSFFYRSALLLTERRSAGLKARGGGDVRSVLIRSGRQGTGDYTSE